MKAQSNLLGQRQGLAFTEVVDGEAIYYLATIRHAVGKFIGSISTCRSLALRLSIVVTTLKLTQKLCWSG